jgi:hypothetical protein
VIRTIANGATAQLRSVADACEDRDEARRIHAELTRITTSIARRHGFTLKVKPKKGHPDPDR